MVNQTSRLFIPNYFKITSKFQGTPALAISIQSGSLLELNTLQVIFCNISNGAKSCKHINNLFWLAEHLEL